MNIGIDLGRTIVTRETGYPPFAGCFNVIKGFIKFGGFGVYIVSRVNSEQKEKALKWLDDNDFYNNTGFDKENLYFCFDKRDKAVFARGLNMDIFIDDRPDVLLHMDDSVRKILFNPYPPDLTNHSKEIYKMQIAYNWDMVSSLVYEHVRSK